MLDFAHLATSPGRYFTGEPCLNGHIAERRFATGVCVECGHIHSVKRPYRDTSAYQRNYYRRDKQRRIVANREWKRANRDRVKEQRQRAIERDPYRIRCRGAAATRNHRALKRGAEGHHTPDDVRLLMILQDGKCAACPATLHKYHVDHVIPLSRNGSNGFENLQLLCPPCNESKGARTMEEWAAIR